jgi:hypothetical protein
MQERVSKICHAQIIPALTAICDKLSPPQEHLQLGKLEIDIGVINENNLEEELADKLLKKFEEQVKELKLTSSFDLDTSPQQVDEEKKEAVVSTQTKVDLLIHFLRFGYVPWWSPYLKTDISQWIKDQFSDDAPILLTAVGDELAIPDVRNRVIRYFSDEQLKSLFEMYHLEDVSQLYNATRQQVRSQSQLFPVPWKNVRIDLLEILLGQLWSGVSTPSLQAQMVSTSQKKKAVSSSFRLLSQKYKLPKNFFEQLFTEHIFGTDLFSGEEWQIMYQQIDTHSKDKPGEKEGDFVTTEPEFPTPRQRDKEPFIEIRNAGLVLLWSYLETLFECLGYVEKKEFLSKKASCRAVHLLHFISTGSQEGEEYEWSLNKLLCGLPPESFVPYEIEISDYEKEEAEAMIEAAISNWKVLKNTSIVGFRDAFLLRNGIISPDLNGWKVQIQRISHDVLLDRLPWPISVIKLPWNENIIHVQW